MGACSGRTLALVLFLVFLSCDSTWAQAGSPKISQLTKMKTRLQGFRDKIAKHIGHKPTFDPSTLEPINDEDPKIAKYITNSGLVVVKIFLYWMLSMFVICMFLVFNVAANLPRNYQLQFTRGPVNNLERLVVPCGLVLLVACFLAVYIKIIAPARDAEIKDPHWKKTFALIGKVCVGLISAIMLLVLVTFYVARPSRAVAFVVGAFLSLGFTWLMTLHIVVAAMFGKWKADENDEPLLGSPIHNNRLESTMNYTPGRILAIFGLSLIASGVPVLEVVHSTERYTDYVDPQEGKTVVAGFEWGRAMRILLATMAALGMATVSLAPKRKDTTSMKNISTVAGGITFISLYFYLALVTLDNHKAQNTAGMLAYSGFILATLSGLLMTLSFVPKLSVPARRIMFAMGEYGTILALFPTMIARYSVGDMAALRAAISIWGFRS